MALIQVTLVIVLLLENDVITVNWKLLVFMLDPGLTISQLLIMIITVSHEEGLWHLCILDILGRVVVHRGHSALIIKVWSSCSSCHLCDVYWYVIVLIQLSSTLIRLTLPIIMINIIESSQSWYLLIKTLRVKLGRICFTLHDLIRIVASCRDHAIWEKLMAQTLVTGWSVFRVPW